MRFDLAAERKAFWTLPETVSWIIFAHPSQPLPSRGESVEEIALALVEAEAIDHGDELTRPEVVRSRVELEKEFMRIMDDAVRDPQLAFAKGAALRAGRHFLAKADKELATALQEVRLPAVGRRAPSAFRRPCDEILHSEITAADLVGVVIVGCPLSPPRESWLVVADRISGAARRAWFDVQIPADRVRAEFPTPLLGEPPPEGTEEGLDHELWLLAVAEAYRHPNGEEMMCWDRKQVIDWYLRKHPTLAERIRWHNKAGTRASVVRILRAQRLGEGRHHNIPHAHRGSAIAALQSDTDRPRIAEWLADYKLRNPQSSGNEELDAAKKQFPGRHIPRELIRDLRKPPGGGQLRSGRKPGKKVAARPP